MVWRQDTHQVYVILNDGRWNQYVENWKSSDVLSCSGNFIARGFGQVYCNHPEAGIALGNARGRERVGSTIFIQAFTGGIVLRISQVGTQVLEYSAISTLS